jgi:8-oxo-dGTP pyrophosphatase MutT (NUDIX family)
VSVPDWLQPLLSAVEQEGGAVFDALPGEPPPDVRRSAVLVLFGDGPRGGDVLLIQRTPHLRSHAGQPAFPGGGIDPTDASAAAAAVREAEEETGLDPAGVEVLTDLAQIWVPPSGNVVTPVLAWWREPSEVRPVDLGEVASVSRVPIADLVAAENRFQVRHPSGTLGPAFDVADMLVWGFTAGVLARLLSLGGWEQPWDRDRVRDLPDDVLRLARRERERRSLRQEAEA